jgi:hypothetical protein
MQHATAQELNQFKWGDFYAAGKDVFYAAGKDVVQQPTAQELNQARQGDFYAPGAGE